MVHTAFSQESRHCPTCGGRIEGRSDKRFCSTKCRALHNQTRRNERDAPLTEVLRTVRHNRNLLKKLCPDRKAIVKREVLEAMGFNPRVFSSLYVNPGNQTYYYCGDFGFRPMSHDGIETALIIRREPYATSPDPWQGII